VEGGTASTQYDVPYHGSVRFVCPSNDFDSQNILKGDTEDGQLNKSHKKIYNWTGKIRKAK
jgi:hypothetical protein